MLALAGLLVAGCGDGGGGGSAARIPSAAELAGTYDLTTTPDGDTPSIGGVGLVSDDLHIELSAPYVSLHGLLGQEGTVALEGMTLGSDAITPLTGHASVEQRDDVYRVSGTIDAMGPFGATTFVMERGVGADQRSKSGRYRATLPHGVGCLDCEGHIDFDIVVGFDGTGTAAGAPEFDQGRIAVGRTGTASVLVAPHGGFMLAAPYGEALNLRCGVSVSEFGGCRITLQGNLPDRGVASTTASLLVQDFMTFVVADGTATITRLDE
jgi:hypothetical protein